MRLAIMQPYLFPYIGYYQLIEATDKFVFYDDVNFIKQGWVNRNQVLVNGQANMFTVPVQKISSFTSIRNTLIDDRQYGLWKKKFLRTLEQNYNKAPFFGSAFTLVDQILSRPCNSISDLCQYSVIEICAYLQLEKVFVKDPGIYANTHLKAQARVIDICRQEQANVYINSQGGSSLYSKSEFKANGIDLYFIKSTPQVYRQLKNYFIPYLSVIDVLMFNSQEEVCQLLFKYELV